jgi:hypothetical protein
MPAILATVTPAVNLPQRTGFWRHRAGGRAALPACEMSRSSPLSPRAAFVAWHRTFCEDLERAGARDWQVRQAEHAIRLYFVNFLQRTDWRRPPASTVIEAAPVLDGLRGTVRPIRSRARSICCVAPKRDGPTEVGPLHSRPPPSACRR